MDNSDGILFLNSFAQPRTLAHFGVEFPVDLDKSEGVPLDLCSVRLLPLHVAHPHAVET